MTQGDVELGLTRGRGLEDARSALEPRGCLGRAWTLSSVRILNMATRRRALCSRSQGNVRAATSPGGSYALLQQLERTSGPARKRDLASGRQPLRWNGILPPAAAGKECTSEAVKEEGGRPWALPPGRGPESEAEGAPTLCFVLRGS
jgi:hypothetical protein